MRVETKCELRDSSSDFGVLWLDSPYQEEFVVSTEDEHEMQIHTGDA